MDSALSHYIETGKALDQDEREVAALALQEGEANGLSDVHEAWQSEIQHRVDEILNGNVRLVPGGTTLAAINAFLKQAVRERRIPFEITAASPNAATIEAILQGKAMLNDPNTEVFQDAASLRKALDVREDRHAR